MDASAELNRLRWRCTRRALLEMEILLGAFLDTKYVSLNPAQAAAFVKLADMEDNDLWPLVMGKRDYEDSTQAEVVAMLRDVRVK